eukprot:403370146
MEQFKIKDFNTAFQIGIEKLVWDSINDVCKKKKNPEKLKIKKCLKILKKQIFKKLDVEYINKENHHKQQNKKDRKNSSSSSSDEDIEDEDLNWILNSLVDPTLSIKKGKKPKIETERFVTFIHKFYYDQLRLEAQSDPQKEDMLYQNAIEIKEVSPDDANINVSSTAIALLNSTKLFDALDLSQLAVRDNGVLKIEKGAAINKKFKYFNNTDSEMSIEIIANIPQIICVKTNQITIPKNGGFDFVKFLVLAPKTACYIDAKILIRNIKTKNNEELVIFRVDRLYSCSVRQPQKPLLLEGYRVIDASRILVGAFSSLMLSDMGAEVIKIEQPGVGDETRKWGPPFKGPDSTYFISINRNKKSITVDLKQHQGKKIVYDLIKAQQNTIFLANFTPSALEKLSIDYEKVKSLNPAMIYGSVQGFPQDSLWKDKAAFDLTIQAMSGLMNCTGDPKGSPFKVGYAVTDVLAGMHLLQGIMGAIIHKERTGEGQMVNTSLLEANLYSLCYVVSSWINGQTEYKRMGNSHPNIAPYSVFKTRDDQFIVIGVATDLQFQKLCELLGMPINDMFLKNRDRCQNRELLQIEIQSYLSKNWDKDHLIQQMTNRGIPFSEIHSVKSLFEQAEIQSMNLNQSIHSDKYGNSQLHFSKNPLHFEKLANAEMQEPPLLGEHTEDILRNILKYDDNYINELRDLKVI